MSTPMLEQYLAIKKDHPGAILFFRLGDFYEMFNDDALIASKELELTLTSREAGRENRLPMCGVPFHAASTYIGRLVERGYKVAICEQVEDPREVKGIVRREVVRVITPGTFAEGSSFEKGNGFIACVTGDKDGFGFAYADISTGEFQATQWNSPEAADSLADELFRVSPLEVVLAPGWGGRLAEKGCFSRIPQAFRTEGEENSFRFERARQYLLEQFGVSSVEGFGCSEWPLAVTAAGALLAYLRDTQKTLLPHLNRLQSYSTQGFMYLDSATRRNLELTRTMREGDFRGSLLWVLDSTVTPMGRRLMRRWIEQPLIEADPIRKRHLSVEELCSRHRSRYDIRSLLEGIYDIERLTGRVALGAANARDVLALRFSLEKLPPLQNILRELKSPFAEEHFNSIDPLSDAVEAIRAAIDEDAPVSLKEGGIIRLGFHPALDELRSSATNAKVWVSSLETRERERTGIKSLKISFNHVFGYYIEVTRANLGAVPSDYQRKQTLANCERFVTPELKQYEEQILGASEKSIALEYELFTQLRSGLATHIPALQANARVLAELDVLCSLAETAIRNHYVKPEIDDNGAVFIKEGRHPVVERMMPSGSFIPNDIYLDSGDNRLHVITGPNMAGKSTYLRQVALIVLLAQMGSFVPAAAVRIGLTDRVFTRVGASDDLATGQSTFMVEMNELANILNHATRKSLLILDEIGRGTSTFDGLSIAWSVIEYLQNPASIGAKTLFATHYHELTELEGLLPGIRNFQVSVKKDGEDIIFLRKITPGGADRSYGIEVARLAGLPEAVLERARQILVDLEHRENRELSSVAGNRRSQTERGRQLPLFTPSHADLLAELQRLDLSAVTPLAALNLLYDWQKRYGTMNAEAAAAREENHDGNNSSPR